MRLHDRVAVVTGGGGGIGRAISTALAAAGASVAVWDVNGIQAVETAEALRREWPTGRFLPVEVDICDRSAVSAALVETEAELGPVDVLVNNAGIDRIGPFLKSDERDWGRIVEVNLLGTIRCSHVVLPGMVERNRGVIVNIGSDAGKVGSSGEAVYSATKGGIIAFTKTLAREVAASGVRVNCVCPGPTDTALLGQVAEVSPKLLDSLARAVPMKRIGQPDDIAPAVVFLACDGAGYITGQSLSVSGGLTMC
jgi:2-hydroxycyclohexanecarboxyl-CoA dehydrogenase